MWESYTVEKTKILDVRNDAPVIGGPSSCGINNFIVDHDFTIVFY